MDPATKGEAGGSDCRGGRRRFAFGRPVSLNNSRSHLETSSRITFGSRYQTTLFRKSFAPEAN